MSEDVIKPRSALRIALWYAALATAWILLSDTLVGVMFADLHPRLNIIKGLAFVAITSLLLFWLLRRWQGQLLVQARNLQATLAALPDLLFEIDLNGRYLDYHSPRTELLAAPPEMLLGKTLHEVLPPAAAETGMAALREAQTSGFSQGKQIELALSDGPHWFELSVARKAADGGATPRFIVLSRDITARKLAERAAQRMSKLYAALSQCNQAIVRCKDESELFPIVCRDAVNFGGMKMAWIGMLDATGQKVKPVASLGTGIEYLEGIDITLDPALPSGRGPTGTAMRENQPFWCQDFQHNPATAAWHERGARFGWGASASLPLHRQGKVVGAFNLYAEMPFDFDEAARNLLVEMTMDISLALDRFALEIEHKRTHRQLLESEARYRTAFHTSPDSININRLQDGLYLDVNDGFERISGWQRDEVIGKTSAEINIWRNAADRQRLVEALRRDGSCENLEAEFVAKNGRIITGLMSARIIEIDGVPCILNITRDITEKKKIEEALLESEMRFRTLFENSLDGVMLTATDGSILFANPQCQRIIGYTEQELQQLGRGAIVDSNDPRLAAALAEREKTGHFSGELTLVRKDGSRFEAELSTQIFQGEKDRKLTSMVIRDITLRKQNEMLMTKLTLAVDQNPNSIVITDLDARIEYANATFSKITGYSLEEVQGQNPRILQSGRTPKATYEEMWARLTAGKEWHGELFNRRKDGSEYIESAMISPVRQTNGKITNYLAIKQDITAKRRDEERIQQLAHFDQLTGLPNRSLLNERFSYALSLAQRSGEPLAVMFLDLDHFKNINDTLGHSIGDRFLIEVAQRLRAILREEDTVSRLGGDEFILVFPRTDADGAAIVAGKLIDTVSKPYRINEHELIGTPSIGIAIYPDDGDNFEALLKNADTAMYRVKQDSRNDFRFFTAEMQAHSERNLQLVNALRHALEGNELQLHYQPQVAMGDGRVIGAEALLRWNHPVLGMISPAEFIPIAEDSGQIIVLGEWVLRTAVKQMKDWQERGLPPMVVAVNLSAIQFRQPGLPELVSHILEEAQLAPEYLELELTEAVAMDDPQTAVSIMDDLFARGIRMSIDDFGTGYSSLSYLKRFKVFKLKIDQSFVRNISDDPEDKAIVTAIINLASILGLHTIAEGVETAAQLAFLRLQGCDEVQGYYFSKPLPKADFEAFVRKRG